MSNDLVDQVISLSAVVQCTLLIEEIATTGFASQENVKPMIDSLFIETPDTALDVYGSLNNLRKGLNVLGEGFLKQPSKNPIVYFNSLLQLQKKIQNEPQLLMILDAGISTARAKLNFYNNIDEPVLYVLNDIYTQTISKLKPRIMIKGDPQYLSLPVNIAKIRSLLLAGIRAGILWSQCNGTRLNLIFNLKKVASVAKELAKS